MTHTVADRRSTRPDAWLLLGLEPGQNAARLGDHFLANAWVSRMRVGVGAQQRGGRRRVMGLGLRFSAGVSRTNRGRSTSTTRS